MNAFLSSYISVIKDSFFFFPAVAFFFTIPYIIWNYHKYGSIWSIRIVVIYSLLLYMMTVLFLTSLPLPSREYVASLKMARAQLIPFHFVHDIVKNISESPASLDFWIAAMKTKAFKEYVANIAMCVPFGMYLRYYFKQSIPKCILYTFLFSLLIETTQLTGLWGIYPRNYRLFDVDDLMSNTLGGFLGALIVSPFLRWLPNRRKMDRNSFVRGRTVSLFRRIVAMGIDLYACFMIALLLDRLHLWPMSLTKLYMLVCIGFTTLFAWIFKGQSLGMLLTSLKIVNAKTRRTANRLAIFGHLALEYGIAIGIPLFLVDESGSLPWNPFLVSAILCYFYASFMICSVVLCFTRRQSIPGVLTNTIVVSDIRVPESSQ